MSRSPRGSQSRGLGFHLVVAGALVALFAYVMPNSRQHTAPTKSVTDTQSEFLAAAIRLLPDARRQLASDVLPYFADGQSLFKAPDDMGDCSHILDARLGRTLDCGTSGIFMNGMGPSRGVEGAENFIDPFTMSVFLPGDKPRGITRPRNLFGPVGTTVSVTTSSNGLLAFCTETQNAYTANHMQCASWNMATGDVLRSIYVGFNHWSGQPIAAATTGPFLPKGLLERLYFQGRTIASKVGPSVRASQGNQAQGVAKTVELASEVVGKHIKAERRKVVLANGPQSSPP